MKIYYFDLFKFKKYHERFSECQSEIFAVDRRRVFSVRKYPWLIRIITVLGFVLFGFGY